MDECKPLPPMHDLGSDGIYQVHRVFSLRPPVAEGFHVHVCASGGSACASPGSRLLGIALRIPPLLPRWHVEEIRTSSVNQLPSPQVTGDWQSVTLTSRNPPRRERVSAARGEPRDMRWGCPPASVGGAGGGGITLNPKPQTLNPYLDKAMSARRLFDSPGRTQRLVLAA